MHHSTAYNVKMGGGGAEVQKLIRDYYARMYAAIGTEVVIYPDDKNLLF